MLLEGIFPAITTPFNSDGRLYLRKLEHNVDRYSRTPIAGLTVLGSTGESVMLSDDETREVLHAARKAAAVDKVLVAGVGRESLVETLRLIDYAAGQNYDVALVRTPSFYGAGTDPLAMLTYYRALADRSALPILLYSNPACTHYALPVELVAELAQHTKIIGIKDSAGSEDRLKALLKATSTVAKRKVEVTPVFTAVTERMVEATALAEAALVSISGMSGDLLAMPAAATGLQTALKTRTKEVGFQVLTGDPTQIYAALSAGASGAMVGLAAAIPQACQEIYWAWKDNDPQLAEQKQQQILAAAKIISADNGIAGIKHACDLNGYYGGVPRLPLLSTASAARAEIAEALVTLRH